jgi:hypothetical protein
MDGMAGINKTEETPERQSEKIVIPSYYAVSNFIRNIARINAETIGKGHWIVSNIKMWRKKKLDIHSVAMEIISGPRKNSHVSSRIEEGKRLGKPLLKVISNRLVADQIVGREDDRWGKPIPILVMRREFAEIRKDHMEEHSVVTGFAICRHALERMYERREFTQDDMSARIRNDIRDIAENLAFAIRARLCSGQNPEKEGAEFRLPAGKGLLIIKNIAFLMKKDIITESRLTPAKCGKMYTHPVKKNTRRVIAVDPVEDMDLEGHIMSLGITYITENMMSFEQLAYVSMFREEVKKHDIARISDETYRIRMKHEPDTEFPNIHVNDRLHYLLSMITRPKNTEKRYFPIGWDGSYDRRS